MSSSLCTGRCATTPYIASCATTRRIRTRRPARRLPSRRTRRCRLRASISTCWCTASTSAPTLRRMARRILTSWSDSAEATTISPPRCFRRSAPPARPEIRENCSLCHTNSSEQNLPLGKNPVVDPQGWINPVQAIAGACSGCHTSESESSHFLANTTSLGESCTVCHSSGAAYAVDQVHAQY